MPWPDVRQMPHCHSIPRIRMGVRFCSLVYLFWDVNKIVVFLESLCGFFVEIQKNHLRKEKVVIRQLLLKLIVSKRRPKGSKAVDLEFLSPLIMACPDSRHLMCPFLSNQPEVSPVPVPRKLFFVTVYRSRSLILSYLWRREKGNKRLQFGHSLTVKDSKIVSSLSFAACNDSNLIHSISAAQLGGSRWLWGCSDFNFTAT